MKTRSLFALLSVLTLSLACVPAKKLHDLEQDYDEVQQENDRLKRELEEQSDRQDGQQEALEHLQNEKEKWAGEKRDLKQKNNQLKEKFEHLKQSYDALEKNSSSALAENSKQNRSLLEKIERKQDELKDEKDRLEKLKQNLKERGKRIDELEAEITSKENQMKSLKDKITSALTDFQGKGLSVHRKNGKVYVSMENKLLFKSASWSVNARGRQAVDELGKVLADNPDIHVLIEGHTDNAAYHGRGNLDDNWDLSTKRATAIVHILMKNKQINPKQLTAAGRSKYSPVATNSTAKGRAKNRRIEVVLTPEWDKLSELLKDE